MSMATWFGIRIKVLRRSGMWVTVEFQQSCAHFDKKEVVCLSDVNIRFPIVPSKKCPVVVHTLVRPIAKAPVGKFNKVGA
jgi:hypothetical protein